MFNAYVQNICYLLGREEYNIDRIVLSVSLLCIWQAKNNIWILWILRVSGKLVIISSNMANIILVSHNLLYFTRLKAREMNW